jgi:hypothetical protein
MSWADSDVVLVLSEAACLVCRGGGALRTHRPDERPEPGADPKDDNDQR